MVLQHCSSSIVGVSRAVGAALAEGKGKLAVQGATDAGQALQDAVPEGAKNPKTREDRNSQRDQGLGAKVNMLKARTNADAMMAGAVEKGGNGNIFSPLFNKKSYPEGSGVAFDTAAAPSLQVNVSEKLNQKAGAAAQDVGKTVKKAAEQVKTAAPVYSREQLQVAVNEQVRAQASGAAKDAGKAIKNAAKKVSTAAPVYEPSSLQVNTSSDPLSQAKDALSGAGGSLGDKIKDAAITNDSPQKQLEQAGDKAKQANDAVKQRSNVVFTPAAARSLQVNVGSMDNASFQGPESNEGGITQGNKRDESELPGNPKRGGDLKDASTAFSSSNKGERDEGTPGQTGAAPRNPSERKGLLPGALGGKGLLRDDSETPEEAASGNIAKAQQTTGSPLDGIKNALSNVGGN